MNNSFSEFHKSFQQIVQPKGGLGDLLNCTVPPIHVCDSVKLPLTGKRLILNVTYRLTKTYNVKQRKRKKKR